MKFINFFDVIQIALHSMIRTQADDQIWSKTLNREPKNDGSSTRGHLWAVPDEQAAAGRLSKKRTQEALTIWKNFILEETVVLIRFERGKDKEIELHLSRQDSKLMIKLKFTIHFYTRHPTVDWAIA